MSIWKNNWRLYCAQHNPLNIMIESYFANIQWVVCDIVNCQCFWLVMAFYGALNDAKDPVHVACTNNVRTRLLVQVFLQVFLFVPLVPCYSNFSYWYDWYETRRNTLYKTICSVSLSTGSCQYNGGMWIITPIFLYFVNFCICLSAMGWPFLCCLNEESL